MRALTPDIHVAEARQGFLGLEVGARMTVMRLGDDLLVHSPIALPPESVTHLGRIRWVVAPNRLHHLYAGPWSDGQGVELCGVRGLPEKRADLRFDRVLEDLDEPFGPDVLAFPMHSFPFANEVVLLHRPSRTLVVTDLCFHLTPEAPWMTRAAFWCLGGYPGCKVTHLERFGMKRRLARRELTELLDLDFDRLLMSHGAVIETGGKEALAGAFDWLL